MLLPLFSLFAVAAASSLPHQISKRDATGDSKCTTYMCVSAVVNGSTVQYTLSGTGKQAPAWMGMGFGSQMANSPMVIIWGNSDGTFTLSQRQAPAEVMPTLVSSPPRVATLSKNLTTTSGNAAFVYTIPANSDTTQNVIWAFGNINPGSTSESATLQQHLDSGTFQLDLTKSLSTSTSSGSVPGSTGTPGSSDDSSSGDDSTPLTSQQRMIIAHAIVCVVGFALLLPIGVLVARYLRTSTPTWYTGHWIAQFGIAGPTIIAGVVLGFKVNDKIGSDIMDDHKKTGIVLLALYLAQCTIGALIHYVKPKNATSRPPQNYFHAVLGLTIIGLAMWQIRTGYNTEWPIYGGRGKVPKGVNTLWIVWCVLLPVLYAGGLAFLPKQYQQEAESRESRKGR
ncbi:hypothetical protein C8R44DRAFT_701105 [Mycena epipterygia]|nr:hypothetical protein C8R44DRAFT_701105 [Mycena epipterygia]